MMIAQASPEIAKSFIQRLPEILKSVAGNPFGYTALIIITLSVLSLLLFKGSKSKEKIRLIVFCVIAGCGLLLSVMLIHQAKVDIATAPTTDASPANTVSSEPPASVPAPDGTNLEVEFAYLHVYLDGSPFKDTWSVWGIVNGVKTNIWNHKKDISDNCNDQLGVGPGGDGSACQYSLACIVPVTLRHGETLQIAFEGKAHDQNDQVPRSLEIFNEIQNWGIGGETYNIQGKQYRRMGNVNAGQTEYYMYYRVLRP